jgi:hypothetical protein
MLNLTFSRPVVLSVWNKGSNTGYKKQVRGKITDEKKSLIQKGGDGIQHFKST